MPRMLLSLAVAAVMLAVPAAAKDKPTNAGKSDKSDKGKSDKGKVGVNTARPRVVFEESQRGAVRSWWVGTYGRGNCPPGLAKKNNHCLPPGQAKKRYVVGQRLPTAITWQPVPQDLIVHLGPIPSGYQYVMLDGDVLKLSVSTRLVVDAISAIVD